MKFAKNLLLSGLILTSFGLTGYSLYDRFLPPCAKPLKYSIGRFDKQFGVSELEFKNTIEQAERVWEKVLEKEAFTYDATSKFKINLIYDARQQATVQKQKTEFGLTMVEDIFKKLDTQFNQMSASYDNLVVVHESNKKNFEQRQNAYEQKVSYWNSHGGAPKTEYSNLQEEARTLNNYVADLNQIAANLNRQAKDLNLILEKRNIAASEYNRVAKTYNQKYGEGLEFDQAEYTGQAINIYQFSTHSDLLLAMSHEFGHALGMEHVENPDSIMYYITKDGADLNLSPSKEDLVELNRVCKIK